MSDEPDDELGPQSTSAPEQLALGPKKRLFRRRARTDVPDPAGPDETPAGDKASRQRSKTGKPIRRRLTRLRLRWLVVAIIVLVLAAGGTTWALLRSGKSQVSQITATVQRQTVKTTVGATGTLEPAQRADLSFPVSGTVKKVRVSVGDTVHKGQALASIDTSSLQAAVDSAKAQLDASQQQLTQLQDAGSSDTQIDAAKADVAVNKSQLTQAEQQLAGATLTAPFAGKVAAVNIAVGDSSGQVPSANPSTNSSGTGSTSGAGSSNSTTSTAAVTIISSDTYVMDASVSTADRSKVKKGLQAQITPSGTTQTVFGTVSSVGVMADASSSGGSTVAVTIAVTGKQKDLFPGAGATATIIVTQRQNVLTVPTAAIHSANGKTVVDVLTDGRAKATTITIGASYGSVTEVTSGVTAGQTVVIATRTLPAGVPTSRASGGPGGRGGFGGGGFGGGGFGGGTFPGAGERGGFGGVPGGQGAGAGQGGR